jgi:hypothetical protein
MGFTKLDSGIIDSSLWDEHSNVLKVFVAFWTKCNFEGIVDATFNAMFRAANLCDENKSPLSIEHFEKALDVLLLPDKSSRSDDYEGRRIVRIEESKWLVVTYAKRRDTTYSNKPDSIRKREYRNKSVGHSGTSWDMSQSVPGHSGTSGHSAYVSVSDSVSVSEFKKEEGIQGGKEKTKYIDYVFLTADEHARLKKELGQKFLDACIFKLDAYLSNDEAKRRKYKDHNKVIRNWVIDEIRKKMNPEPEKDKPPPPAQLEPQTAEEKAAAEEAMKIFNEQVEKIVKHVSIPEPEGKGKKL